VISNALVPCFYRFSSPSLLPSSQPHRVRMAHNLIVNYGLYKEMDIFVRRLTRIHVLACYIRPSQQRPPLVDHTELTRFHSDDYINFIRGISPDNMQDHLRELQRCKLACARGCRRFQPPSLCVVNVGEELPGVRWLV